MDASSKFRISSKSHERLEPQSRRPRDADATKELLLATAEAVFTELGFNGARVDEIAERAQVNKRMIYVYFGDKEGIYAATLRRAFSRIAQRAQVSEDKTIDPADRLRQWISEYFRFLSRQPEIVRLAEWEALAGGTRAASALLEVAQQELVDLMALLQTGTRSGRFRPDLQPQRALMTIHALCFGTLSRRRLWKSLWQLDLEDETTSDSISHFIADVVINGIGSRSK